MSNLNQDPTDQQLLEIYRLGWNDSLNSTKKKSYPTKLLQRAYDLGVIDAIVGDDVSSIDFQTEAEILKSIKNQKIKINEAKQIVSEIINWNMVCIGVIERSELKTNIDLSKYSLEDLIKANSLVESSNKRKMNLQKTNQEKGRKSKGISMSMTLADRIIAAVYTAMNFNPDGEIIALVNDIGVGLVKVKYE